MKKLIATIAAASMLVVPCSAQTYIINTDEMSLQQLLEYRQQIDREIYQRSHQASTDPYDIASADSKDAAYHVAAASATGLLTVKECTGIRESGWMYLYYKVPESVYPSRSAFEDYITTALKASRSLFVRQDLWKLCVCVMQPQRDKLGRLVDTLIFQADMAYPGGDRADYDYLLSVVPISPKTALGAFAEYFIDSPYKVFMK